MVPTYSTHTYPDDKEAKTGVNALGEIRKTRKCRQRHKQEQVVIHLVRQERAGMFLFRKESASTIEGFKFARLVETMVPVFENKRSEGTDIAGIARSSLAIRETVG